MATIRGVFIRSPEEVVKIVRCEECRHWDETWCEVNKRGFGYCGKLDMTTDRIWWCGSGEGRKE